MKYLIAFLFLLGVSAHAQTNLRTVMVNTNGVLQRPTNFVSANQNALYGTNQRPLLFNATNGQVVYTNTNTLTFTNAFSFSSSSVSQSVRNNLGISNTFAGQFHADFYDDFSRYSNGTQFTNGRSPVIGSNYVLRSGATINDNVVPYITNGTLTGTNTAAWYLNSELSRPVYNFGMEWTWETGKNANLAWPVIIVRPDDTWLTKLLHIVIQPSSINVDVSVTNGAAGFVTIASNNFGSTGSLEAGVRHILSGEIEGNTLRLKLGGRALEITDSRIGEVSGRYFTYEYFGNSPSTNVANIFWHRVWANSPNMMQFANQPFSQNLVDFANGDARVTRYLTVGTNKLAYNETLSASIPAIIDGTIRANGRLQGNIVGNAYGSAPLVNVSGVAAANTNTTNRTVLWNRNLAAGTLATNGQRWEVNAVGSFANNTNEKRVVMEMAGGSQLDTGNITDSGEWRINAIIYRTATNTHEAFAMFQSENTTKMARWTYNVDTTFGVDIEGAATSNNEVILRGVWADWFPQ
jgi:hypothetical protein